MYVDHEVSRNLAKYMAENYAYSAKRDQYRHADSAVSQQFSIRSYQMKTKDKAGQRADRSIVNSKSKNLFHSLNLVKTN